MPNRHALRRDKKLQADDLEVLSFSDVSHYVTMPPSRLTDQKIDKKHQIVV